MPGRFIKKQFCFRHVFVRSLAAMMIATVAIGASACADSATDSAGSGSGPDMDDPGLYVENEQSEQIEVPDVVGEDGADAESELESKGFSVAFAGSADDEDINEPRNDALGCTVLDQYPAGGDVAGEGEEIEISLDCRQVDWENQEGDEWDQYADSFENAAYEGCDALFELSPSESLYDGDWEYTSLDCHSGIFADPQDEAPADVPDDPGALGAALGFEAGCRSIFDANAVFELYYGDVAYSEADCIASSPY